MSYSDTNFLYETFPRLEFIPLSVALSFQKSCYYPTKMGFQAMA